jgi:branched-chain amino acid transport system substrate-binding protein
LSTAGSGPEITAGLSISLSGKFQLQGQQALHGYLLWQSSINGLGGISIQSGEKRALRLLWYDDRSQISWAQNNVLRLLQQDRIEILLGPYSSSLKRREMLDEIPSHTV